MIGTGAAFYRVDGAGKAQALSPTMTAPQGKGPVKDLVIRFTGPRTLVASGHAAEPGLPTNIGLASSSDQGKTWTPVSGIDEFDYHELEVHSGRLFAFPEDGSIQVSQDGGRTFAAREAPSASPPLDIAVNPADPAHWVVSNQSGTFTSTNEGRSWRQRDTTSSPRLVWTGTDKLFAIGLDGTVRHSADGGRSWTEKGMLGGGPKEVAAAPDGTLYAITAGGKVHRSPDGVQWQPVTQVT